MLPELSFPHASYLVQDVHMAVFASLRLFTSLVYVSTYCLPIAHLHQNKPFPLLYLGRVQIINIQYLLYVDRFMPRFPCLFRGKYFLENVGNGISECLGFKIFWGSMPPDPPRRLLFQHNLLLKNLLKALHIHNYLSHSYLDIHCPFPLLVAV